MNHLDLVDQHPEILGDRHALAFSRHNAPSEIAAAFARAGVIQLKDALPAALLDACAQAFARYIGTLKAVDGQADSSWHSPWAVRDGDNFPLAAVLSAVIRSWTWDVVEELCGSSHIVVLLKWCTARHSIDQPLGIGPPHQDAKVVAFDVPFSIWIPLMPITPRRNSGLGFVVPGPDGLLPAGRDDEIDGDYLLRDHGRLWVPSYDLGDLTIHTRFSPHFTTGYGSLSDRFSLEIRAMPRRTAPAEYIDPAIYVSRRGGIPTIVEMHASPGVDVGDFLDSAPLRAVAA